MSLAVIEGPFFFIALFGMVFAVILCLASNFPSSTGV